MIENFYTDYLDGAITLFKSTDEGTETIAVFNEEHREVIEYLAKEVNRFREFWQFCKDTTHLVYRLRLAHEYIAGLDSNDYDEWLKSIGEEGDEE